MLKLKTKIAFIKGKTWKCSQCLRMMVRSIEFTLNFLIPIRTIWLAKIKSSNIQRSLWFFIFVAFIFGFLLFQFEHFIIRIVFIMQGFYIIYRLTMFAFVHPNSFSVFLSSHSSALQNVFSWPSSSFHSNFNNCKSLLFNEKCSIWFNNNYFNRNRFAYSNTIPYGVIFHIVFALVVLIIYVFYSFSWCWISRG